MPKKRQSEQRGPLDECAYEEWAPGGKGGPLRIVMGPNKLARVEPVDGENNDYDLVDHVDGTLELLRDAENRLRDCFVTYTTAQQQETTPAEDNSCRRPLLLGGVRQETTPADDRAV